MVKFKGMPEISDDGREIIQKHLNEMLIMTTRFAAGFIGRVPQEQLMWDKKDLPYIRELICPPHVRKDRARKKIILNTLKKPRSSNYEELTAEERYTLARIVEAAFRNEVNVVERLVDMGEEDGLARWMENYRIRDKDTRNKAVSTLLKINKSKWDDTANQYLKSKGKQYFEAVQKIVKEPCMLQIEFPSALYMLFTNKELQLLAGIQPEYETVQEVM